MAIVVVHDDAVVFLKGYGVRRTGSAEPIDPDTVFPLASVSKPITTTVLAALVGEAKAGWNDRIIDHDPRFRLSDPWTTNEVTLADLLCHRSGLPDHAGDQLEDLGYDQAEILRRLRHLKLVSSFRSEYAYTNFGFTAAAVAVARTAGKPWPELAEEKLFEPLGMTATSARFERYANATNRAAAHVRENGEWVARYVRDPDAQAPAGGVSSSARDLARWLRLQLGAGVYEGRRIVDQEALAQTHRPWVARAFDRATQKTSFYGLGWNVDRDDAGRLFLRHSGEFNLGIRTEVALLPREKLGIAILTNAAPTGLPEGITETFFDLVLLGRPRRDWVAFANGVFERMDQEARSAVGDYSKLSAVCSPPLPFAAYVGRFENPYFGSLEIVPEQEGLVLRLGPKPLAFALAHWDRDVFLYQPTGESAVGPAAVTFLIGPERAASAVTLEDLVPTGYGTFPRVRAR